MREAGVYLLASLALGWIAVWAGENLFWTTPAPELRLLEIGVTWLAYAVAAGAALSTVIWSGIGGWRAAFLGGALLGFQIEGAVVGTMYEAFPLQLVWTPLAWHAVVSGLCVLAGGLALARGGIGRQVAGMLALGLFGAVWGLYWPLEGKALAGFAGVGAYLGLGGIGAGLALGVLTRLPTLPRGRWWLWLMPGGVAALWIVGTVLTPSPLRLAGPGMVAVTVWAMVRLGRGGGRAARPEAGARGAGPGLFGPPLPWLRCLAFGLAPLTTTLLVVPGWVILGGVAVNVPVALATGALGLGLWLSLLWRAARG
ncbi:hypothetical protein C0V75_16955 [Tabrizicola sp. TH137]|uniref:hypothetical protein n=1 Tax=Tabrizicola sp. TH137 TaxID=2067452 RepID=UPI000C7BC8D4|nr:hypothetical protein [Tabrizicola sp. TH137]PLL10994.1 hypothetical protein C0V75_16955 [Tabrizicola sp. TH137]